MNTISRKILSAMAAAAILVTMAAVAYGVYYLTLEVKDNYFQTGSVDIGIDFAPGTAGTVDLTDPGLLYEPGMTIRGDFIVINRSTDENGVWCRFYFTNLSGSLADVMEARIYDGQTLICAGTLRELNHPRAMTQPVHLPYAAGGSSRTYTLELHYPESAGNDTQGSTLQYALAVNATQSTQNPNAQFE